VGLALGSGGAFGWAHIGVLQVLEEAGLKPGVVAGTSIGAVVGAA
jgi:NTE family protein